MKKFVLTIALALSLSVSAYAHGGAHIRLIQNYDNEISYSCPIVERNGTLYMGVRDICEFACNGAPVTWNDSLKSAVIGKGDICLYAGSCVYNIRGTEYTASQPAELIDNRLMVPLDMAQAIAGNDSRFIYDRETGEVHYVCPEYLFGETRSDYNLNAVSVDLDDKNMSELIDEVSRIAKAYGLMTDNDVIKIKEVTKVSDGYGTVILSVSGSNPRDIVVQVRNGIAVRICDPCELTPRNMGNGHHGWNK